MKARPINDGKTLRKIKRKLLATADSSETRVNAKDKQVAVANGQNGHKYRRGRTELRENRENSTTAANRKQCARYQRAVER